MVYQWRRRTTHTWVIYCHHKVDNLIPHISKLLEWFFTTVTYFMLHTCMALHTTFQRNQIGTLWDLYSYNCSMFLVFFFFALNLIFTSLKFGTTVEGIMAYCFAKFGAIPSKFEWVMYTIILQKLFTICCHTYWINH